MRRPSFRCASAKPGKTLPDAILEVREAVDFLRFYAAEARRKFSAPLPLPGPTGEVNELRLHGRGVWTCISPWNFPLAIFTGPVAAALAAGNAVMAKPAEQTPLIGAKAVELMHQAGIPRDVVQLVPGDGKVGAALVGASAHFRGRLHRLDRDRPADRRALAERRTGRSSR
jgi:RHH-type transcriptional regulator, proline utilization regulon repressor / proline dehydrogenase / delta 1-pyrroline-5-carboxylate dehydrogenase